MCATPLYERLPRDATRRAAAGPHAHTTLAPARPRCGRPEKLCRAAQRPAGGAGYHPSVRGGTRSARAGLCQLWAVTVELRHAAERGSADPRRRAHIKTQP